MIKVNKKPINILIVFIFCMTVACLDSDKFFAGAEQKTMIEYSDQIGTSWNGKIATGFSGGDGSAASPYQIGNAEELAYLAQCVNMGLDFEDVCFCLTDDIYINDINNFENWDKTAPQYSWVPIGINESRFEGVLDGREHTVNGIYIKNNFDKIGLFGELSEKSCVKNLNIKDVYLENTNAAELSFVGGIVAVSYGTISECSSKGRFYSVIEANDAVPNTNAGNSLGTIAGINYGTIEECNNQCEITNYTINDSCYWGYDGGAGGIVGVTEGKVWNCCNHSRISAVITDAAYCRGNDIGGIAGSAEGEIVNCGNTADIQGMIHYNYSSMFRNEYYISIGGISGSSVSDLVNCYNTGNLGITDTTEDKECRFEGELGGISGTLSSVWSSDEERIGNIYNCYHVGDMSSSDHENTKIGGIAGEAYSENSIQYSYWGNTDFDCCGSKDCNNISNCSAFFEGQRLETAVLGEELLCDALNKWFESDSNSIKYQEYCTLWTVRENEELPVLSDRKPEKYFNKDIDQDNTTEEQNHNIVYNAGVYCFKTKNSTQAILTGLNNRNLKSIKIPAVISLNGKIYQIVEISDCAFQNANITDITIGSNIQSIGMKAFFNCKKLKKVIIPASVNRIGSQAFGNCKKLKNITVKTTKLTKKSVGKKAFKGIHAKAAIKVPKKKLKAYRRLFKSRGAGSKVKYK